MNALDTNALVRLLVGDDERQALAVKKVLMEAGRTGQVLYVPVLVVLEMLWVLSSVYKIDRESILRSLESLLAVDVLEFEAHECISSLCHKARTCATGLGDLLIGLSARVNGCDTVLTFDKSAARTDLFTLI